MTNPFSKILQGVCPICGGTGDYYGDAQNPSATPESVGRGYYLVKYQGRDMCKKCKKWLESQDQNRPMSAWAEKEEVFRRKAGFKDEIT